MMVGGIALMATEAEYLRGAKENAFDSLLALRQARAVSYDANADESRYLIGLGRTNTYERAFLDKSESLAGVGAGDVSRYDDAVTAYQNDNSDVRINGYFGTNGRAR